MHSAFMLVPVVAGWIGLSQVARNLWRRPGDRAARAVVLAVAAAAVVVTLEAFAPGIDRLTGIPNLVRALGNCGTLVAATAGQLCLIHVTHAEPVALRKSRTRWAALAVTVTAILAIFAASPMDPDTSAASPQSDWLTYGSPLTFLYVAYLGPALVEIGWLSWRYAALTGRPTLRWGLRMVAAGAAVGLVYAAMKVLFVVATWLGSGLREWEVRVTPFAFVPAILLLLAGATMPAWGGWAVAAWRLAGQRRAYRRLHPLWSAVHRAVPEIALAPPPSPLSERLDPRRLGFRLYRRVIEIRDGQLALRPFADPAACEVAARVGRRAGLSGDALSAAVEAATLAAACATRLDGGPAPGGGIAPAEAGGGEGLAGEIAWLERVSAALASPVVSASLAELRATCRSGPAAAPPA